MFDPSAEKLARIAFSLPPAYWLIYDARLRRAFVPHVIQPVIVFLWILVVPVYLLSTRKWWGLGYLILHVVCTLVVSMVGYHGSVYFLWPTIFGEGGG
jgi:hypothetical protein